MNRLILSRCILALPALLLFAALKTVGLAQGEGFIETFDDPALPGWERTPNVTVVDGVLRIQGEGYAIRPEAEAAGQANRPPPSAV